MCNCFYSIVLLLLRLALVEYYMAILSRYLMGPGMEFVKFFGKNNDADSLADGIVKEIKQFKK